MEVRRSIAAHSASAKSLTQWTRELSDSSLKPDRWTVKTIGDRVDSEGNPWKGMGRSARKLPASAG